MAPDVAKGGQIRPKLNLRVVSSLEVFFTGGSVAQSRDGALLACACGDEVKVLDAKTGQVVRTLPGDEEPVTAICFAADSASIFVASRSLSNRHFSLSDSRQLRAWKGHGSPVLDMAVDASGTLLATGSADRTIRVWDVEGGFCTHAFKGHSDIVLKVAFHPRPDRPRLVSCANDGEVRIWGLQERKCLHVLSDHTSTATSCCFGDEGRLLFTAGRDSVIHCYLVDEGRLVGAVATYEPIEGLTMLSAKSRFPGSKANAPGERKGSLRLVTAGESGQVKVWDHLTGECMFEQPPPSVKGASGTYADLQAVSGNPHSVLAITSDERLLFLGPERKGKESAWRMLRDVKGRGAAHIDRELVGNIDEVTDVRLACLSGRAEEGDAEGPPEPTHVVVATNSETVRVHRLDTLGTDMSLTGHTDAVLGLDVVMRKAGGGWRAMVATGGKDATVRVWDAASGACLALGEGHMAAVTGVAFSPGTGQMLISVGSDKLLKAWDTGAVGKKLSKAIKAGNESHLRAMEPSDLRVVSAIAAHDRDINCVAVSPNGQLAATGSQDKTCRLWNLPTLTPALVLRGHKRGVWGVAFSPVERAVLTASGDKTLKMWGLKDGACLRTFEGHNGLALRATFVSKGAQVLSSGADGLVKLWATSSGECVNTFDRHGDRVWGLAAGGEGDKVVVTGGADAALRVWEDCTADDEARKMREEQEAQLREQELLNAMRAKDFRKAARLAFRLGHPGRLLAVVEGMTGGGGEGGGGGDGRLEEMARSFGADELRRALEWAREWNTTPRHCRAAQALINAIVRTHAPSKLSKVPGSRDVVEALLSYSRRHLARVSRMERATYLLDYTLSRMAVLTPAGEEAEGEGGGVVGEGGRGEAGVGRSGGERERGGGEDEDDFEGLVMNGGQMDGESEKSEDSDDTGEGNKTDGKPGVGWNEGAGDILGEEAEKPQKGEKTPAMKGEKTPAMKGEKTPATGSKKKRAGEEAGARSAKKQRA